MMATDKPGLEEQYILATNTSDLTLNPDRTCAATHLIAAGLLGNRMGQALVFLRAEWDAAEKPRKATEEDIAFRADLLLAVLGIGKNGKPDIKRARTELLVGYSVAMRHRAHKLTGWMPAVAIMAEWAAMRDVDRDLLSPALYHWLAPTCPVCDGLGQRKMDDAPVLGKQCHHCEGRGIWPRPPGAERIQDWLKGCIGKAKAERSGLLHGRIDSDDLKERTASRRAPMPEDESDATTVAAHFREAMGRRRL